jgi:YD repeat-containing protein
VTNNGKVVTYEYYPSGLVKKCYPYGELSENVQPLQMEYDLQGNRTKLIDPDAGTVVSKYNGLGELQWETAPKCCPSK